jgi:hypothetical protein
VVREPTGAEDQAGSKLAAGDAQGVVHPAHPP